MGLHLTHRPINGQKPIALTLANHFLYYPTPTSLNYNWSFGSLAGLFFALQLVTGIFMAMYYTPHVEWAFASVEHVMTDVNGGYLFRYFHANGASMIFVLIYLHIGRNLYYQSYLSRPILWNTGIIIFLLMMATAFIGYVLPWGQMSFWGATVITSLVTAVPGIGEAIAHWVWGGFSISNATLVRFYALHFTLPFIVLGVIASHLIVLHTSGSSDPLTLAITPAKITFHPYYTLKDAFIFLVVFAFFVRLVCFAPNLLGHSDNFLPADPLVTPAHIVPEWYFTPFYAILRACPNKLGGAIGMFAAILINFGIPALTRSTSFDALMISCVYSGLHKVCVWAFFAIFLVLMFLGMSAAEAPFVASSKLFTALYFVYFLAVLPALNWLTRQLIVSPAKQPTATSTFVSDTTTTTVSSTPPQWCSSSSRQAGLWWVVKKIMTILCPVVPLILLVGISEAVVLTLVVWDFFEELLSEPVTKDRLISLLQYYYTHAEDVADKYTLHPFKSIASNIDTYLLALVASAAAYVKRFIRAVYGTACFLDVDSTDFAELLDGLAATVVNFLTFIATYITFWLRVYVWWLFANTYVLVKRLSGVALKYVDYIWYYVDIFTVVLIILGAIGLLLSLRRLWRKEYSAQDTLTGGWASFLSQVWSIVILRLSGPLLYLGGFWLLAWCVCGGLYNAVDLLINETFPYFFLGLSTILWFARMGLWTELFGYVIGALHDESKAVRTFLDSLPDLGNGKLLRLVVTLRVIELMHWGLHGDHPRYPHDCCGYRDYRLGVFIVVLFLAVISSF